MAEDPRQKEERERAKRRAIDAEVLFEQTIGAELDTGALLKRIDELEHKLFEHIQDWEGVDPAVEGRLRDLAHQLMAYRNKVQEMGEGQIAEAQEIMEYVKRQLGIARGNG